MPSANVANATNPELPAFRDLPSLIAEHAARAPLALALRCGDQTLTYAELDARMDRVAASLQRDGFEPRQSISICAASSTDYLAVFCGALRAGVAVAPLAPSSTATQLADMVSDSGARLFFTDAATLQTLRQGGIDKGKLPPVLRLDEGIEPWLAPVGADRKSVV